MNEVYSVSQVTTYLKELLETNPRLADLWVSGEVSNLSRSPAGHLYFTLKDENAQLRCVFFRRPNMGAALDQGMQVVAHGRVSLYEVRGDLQFYVDFVQPEGVGVLHAQFERLKAQLEEEGLFDEARKRPLPRFPRRIGVVTSPVGAVFHDICNILGRRWPLAEVVLAPTAVQGAEAVSGVVAALTALNDEGATDVIIVARGGGSLEELWAFNEEPVARAIYASRIPVVSAIGHETDYTIADFVADLRAPTPSAAAELVAPDRLEVTVRLSVLAASLLTSCRSEVEGRRAGVSQAVARMERLVPDLARERQRVDDLWRQANTSLEAFLRRWRERLWGFAGQLRSLDPKATLTRGYALVQRDGHVVSSVAEVTGGERLSVRVKDGGFPVRVEKAAGLRRKSTPGGQAEGQNQGVQPMLLFDGTGSKPLGEPTSDAQSDETKPPRLLLAAMDASAPVGPVADVQRLLGEFDRVPLDYHSIRQDRLDLVRRSRTSLFPWRGQFSPEFVEILLTNYASNSTIVADPFVGSGTTLFESARRDLSCVGAEINPAAIEMARTAFFANLQRHEREHHIAEALRIIEEKMSDYMVGGLLWSTPQEGSDMRSAVEHSFQAMVGEASRSPLVSNIIANTIMRHMASRRWSDLAGLMESFQAHRQAILSLPYTRKRCDVLHCDARSLPLPEGTVDLIVTSPPYINVFNYHQNHRRVIELTGWDALAVARSEIGSNRKNRGNRFLTVIQYALDMMQALTEMRRILSQRGRIIIVVGRESKVRGVSFENGRILAALAVGGAGLQLAQRQERRFTTRFGQVIYEDILHFTPRPSADTTDPELPRLLASRVLEEVLDDTFGDVRQDVFRALQQVHKVQPSPLFRCRSEVRSA